MDPIAIKNLEDFQARSGAYVYQIAVVSKQFAIHPASRLLQVRLKYIVIVDLEAWHKVREFPE